VNHSSECNTECDDESDHKELSVVQVDSPSGSDVKRVL
jgi:hypothetical protein